MIIFNCDRYTKHQYVIICFKSLTMKCLSRADNIRHVSFRRSSFRNL